MHSRNGSASATPDTRRKRRRESARRRDANGPQVLEWVVVFMPSLGLKQLALDQLFNKRAHAKVRWLGPLKDRLDLGTVGEANRRAGGKHRELSHEVSCQCGFVLQQQLLELSHVPEGSSIRQLARRIVRQVPVILHL